MSPHDLLSTQFQYFFFFFLSVLNISLGVFGVVGLSINFCVKLFAAESAFLNQPTQEQKTLADAVKAAIKDELDDLTERQPLGRVVGVLERELYLYAMVTQIHAFVGAVLLFKAFSGWLSTQPKENSTEAKATVSEAKSMRTLARYYSYAIGNFISLAWAFIIFELGRWLVMTYPAVRKILWLC